MAVLPDAASSAATRALRHGRNGVRPAAAHCLPDSAEYDGRGAGRGKGRCMHCVHRSGLSVRMLGALHKGAHGVVEYDASKCVGCRYCQVACPFNVPKFEWAKAIPKIVLCELCRHRYAEGKGPACAEVCPRDAVTFGKRGELLAEARRRLAARPEAYQAKIYRESAGGGTHVL